MRTSPTEGAHGTGTAQTAGILLVIRRPAAFARSDDGISNTTVAFTVSTVSVNGFVHPSHAMLRIYLHSVIPLSAQADYLLVTIKSSTARMTCPSVYGP